MRKEVIIRPKLFRSTGKIRSEYIYAWKEIDENQEEVLLGMRKEVIMRPKLFRSTGKIRSEYIPWYIKIG